MDYTLITGGAKGLGRSTAEYLASKGHSIIIQYRFSLEEAKNVVDKCRSYGVEAHYIQGKFDTFLEIEQFIKNYLERFARTKHVVHNVGSYYLNSALETPLVEWEKIFMSNLHLPFMLSQALSPSLIATKGTITSIGVAGLTAGRGDIYSSAYTIAKQALLQFTRSVAKELASKGVRANMISPGYLENSIDLPEDEKKIPIGHPSKFEEVAKVIGFIMDTDTITGQNIEVAGGVRL